jgi:hypothetical protein
MQRANTGGLFAPVAPLPEGHPPHGSKRNRGESLPALPANSLPDYTPQGQPKDHEEGSPSSARVVVRRHTTAFVPGKDCEIITSKIMRNPGESFGLAIGGLYGRFDRVVKVALASPAERAGMRPFDRIIKIDGVSVPGRDIATKVASLDTMELTWERPPMCFHNSISGELERPEGDETKQNAAGGDNNGGSEASQSDDEGSAGASAADDRLPFARSPSVNAALERARRAKAQGSSSRASVKVDLKGAFQWV